MKNATSFSEAESHTKARKLNVNRAGAKRWNTVGFEVTDTIFGKLQHSRRCLRRTLFQSNVEAAVRSWLV